MATNVQMRDTPANGAPQRIADQLVCTLTGRSLTTEEAYWAPPLVTMRQLVTTITRTALHAPADLGRVLLEEQPNVPYAPEAREELARRRSGEQAKLMITLLIFLALIAAPILIFTFR
jgi:hypothetical protein